MRIITRMPTRHPMPFARPCTKAAAGLKVIQICSHTLMSNDDLLCFCSCVLIEQDPNLSSGKGFVSNLFTEMSATELFETRRIIIAKIVPPSRDSRPEAVKLFAELQLPACISFLALRVCFANANAIVATRQGPVERLQR